MGEHVQKLRHIVQFTHDCVAAHIGSYPVTEMSGSTVVWKGVVELFALVGHSAAIRRCYAWSHQDGEERQFVTILEIPPVKDALTAVRSYIAAKTKPNQTKPPPAE